LGNSGGDLADIVKDIHDAWHGEPNPIADVLSNGQAYCDQVSDKCE
jgi:hypothetical protein